MSDEFEPMDQPGGKYWCWKIRDIRDVPNAEKKTYMSDLLSRTSEKPKTPEGTEPVFLGMRTWAWGWFSHHTLDDGQSDEDVLSSFASYVDWVLSLPRGEYPRDDTHATLAVGHLMGAQDMGRWSGQPEDRCPPCRCDGCVKNGLIRITH